MLNKAYTYSLTHSLTCLLIYADIVAVNINLLGSSLFNDHCVVVKKTISVALLLHPGLGLALSDSEQWRT